MSVTKKYIPILLFLFSIVGAFLFEDGMFPSSTGENDAGAWYRVARVIDGDTIELVGGEKVRYIGIDTPETVKPDAPVECFGEEASRENRRLVEGKLVSLERDISDRDRYGRLLRYVFLEDGTLVNGVLVRGGYAYASSFPPDVARQESFREAERDARAEGRGLWNADACDGERRK